MNVQHLGVLAILLFTLAPTLSAQPRLLPTDRPKNVILLIPDGFGPASVTFARDYVRAVERRPVLVFDTLLVGTARTASLNSRVTDSAAAGTALATGYKTKNGHVAVSPNGDALLTVLEAAESLDMATGLVVTTNITDATPATFSAHVIDRSNENEIAWQQLHQGIDVLFGGGAQFFLPETFGGKRSDTRDLFAYARTQGYQVLRSASDLHQSLRLPVLGLFADGPLSLAIDHKPAAEPNLANMTATALDLLKTKSDGFFLMIEGSRIDHAAHANDAAAHLQEILAFEDAFQVVLDFAQRDGETLIVAVADHETGGLGLGGFANGRYGWSPQALANIHASHTELTARIRHEGDPVRVFATYAGITDLTSAELIALQQAPNANLQSVVATIINQRLQIGWTTSGHSAVDVNVYAYGPGWQLFIGNHENTYIGRALATLLGVAVD